MAQTIEPSFLRVREEKTTIIDRFRSLRWSLAHLSGAAGVLIGTLALTWLAASVLLLETFGVLPTSGLQ
jgi:hypothetical protein